MQRKKLAKLLDVLTKEEHVAERRLRETKESANETSKTSRTSWSAAGERDYAQGQVEIIESYYKKIKKLREVVEKSLEKETPKKIEAPSFVSAEIDGVRDEFYLLKNPVNIPNVKFVSEESPLGVSLMGKREGDTFSYRVAERRVMGKVLKVD